MPWLTGGASSVEVERVGSEGEGRGERGEQKREGVGASVVRWRMRRGAEWGRCSCVLVSWCSQEGKEEGRMEGGLAKDGRKEADSDRLIIFNRAPLAHTTHTHRHTGMGKRGNQ